MDEGPAPRVPASAGALPRPAAPLAGPEKGRDRAKPAVTQERWAPLLRVAVAFFRFLEGSFLKCCGFVQGRLPLPRRTDRANA